MLQTMRQLILSKRFGLLSLFLILPLFAVGVGTINRFGDVVLDSVGSNPIIRAPQIPTGAVASGKDLTIQTGNNDGTGISGNMSVYSGYTTSGASGWAAVISGDATAGASGDAYLKSGSSSTNAGDVWVLGGFGTTTGGDVTIEPGIGATDGKIYLQNSAEGTIGHVWTSTDVNGGGEWEAPSQVLALQTKSTTYVVLPTDHLIFAATAGGIWTLTLYTPVGNTGKVVRVLKTDSSFNPLTVTGTGFSTTLNTISESISVVSDGTNWVLLNRSHSNAATSWTPTIDNSGSVTITAAYWVRRGHFLHGNIIYTGGTGSASTLAYSLPSGLTIDSTICATQLAVGRMVNNAVTQANISCIPGNSTTKLYASIVINSGASVVQWLTSTYNGNAFALGTIFSVDFDVPISGWN